MSTKLCLHWEGVELASRQQVFHRLTKDSELIKTASLICLISLWVFHLVRYYDLCCFVDWVLASHRHQVIKKCVFANQCNCVCSFCLRLGRDWPLPWKQVTPAASLGPQFCLKNPLVFWREGASWSFTFECVDNPADSAHCLCRRPHWGQIADHSLPGRTWKVGITY